jgi:putative membrane protein
MIPNYTDHAANERTFLAWVRTGIAIIALGFVIEKFNLFLITMANSVPNQPIHRAQLERLAGPLGRYGGVALVFGGLALILISTGRFLRTEKLLDDAQAHRSGVGRMELGLLGLLVMFVAALSAYLAVG